LSDTAPWLQRARDPLLTWVRKSRIFRFDDERHRQRCSTTQSFLQRPKMRGSGHASAAQAHYEMTDEKHQAVVERDGMQFAIDGGSVLPERRNLI
jgi:hypothetical protein